MKFDPTYDYINDEINDEENLVYYKFCELIKTLYTVGSDANYQREIKGIGSAVDEMALDMDSNFTSVYEEYIKYGLLPDTALEKLKELDKFFDQKSENSDYDFWDDRNLDTNVEWMDVRKRAKEIIELLGMQGLKLEYDRTLEISEGWAYGIILCEIGKRKLAKAGLTPFCYLFENILLIFNRNRNITNKVIALYQH